MNAPVDAPRARHGPPTSLGRDDRDTWLAWACLVAAPVAFVLGWNGVAPPVGVGVPSLVVAPVVFGVPAALATWLWSRAHRRGDDRARVPAAILVVLSLGFLAANLLAWVLDVVARSF